MVGMSWMMADGADARSGQRATSPQGLRHPGGALPQRHGRRLQDYAAGGDLHALLKRRTLGDRAFFLPEAWIWRAFAQICGGLEHLHAAGVVHRDIKALNVLVSPTTKAVWDEPLAPPGLAPLPAEPNLKLADLGVSRQVSENTQFLRTMYGTPLYASPELCEGGPTTRRRTSGV
ncbi:serine/threonine kinase [Aureococcus anophagefferens]|nr:serine/threonine kinase [Aureococcus anophagefferens]